MSDQVFEGEAGIGVQVFYYPGGRRNEGTRPYVGFVRWGHPGGVADLTLLPDVEGACDLMDMVPHAGSSGAKDRISGGLHPNAKKRGTWVFAPWAWEHLQKTEPKPVADAPAKAKAK